MKRRRFMSLLTKVIAGAFVARELIPEDTVAITKAAQPGFTEMSMNYANDGKWHHCAVVGNGRDRLTYYIDGVNQ